MRTLQVASRKAADQRPPRGVTFVDRPEDVGDVGHATSAAYAPAEAGKLDLRQRSIEVSNDVVRVFDTHREAQRALVDAEARPLLRRDASVGGDRRIEHLAEEVAKCGRGGGELQCVEEAERGRLRRVFEIERDNAAEQTVELTFRELVLRVVGQTRIADARDLRMRREMPSHVQ